MSAKYEIGFIMSENTKNRFSLEWKLEFRTLEPMTEAEMPGFRMVLNFAEKQVNKLNKELEIK